MSLPQEAGKVASSAIDALKGSPGMLSIILLQITTLGALYLISTRNNEHRQAREMYMLEHCFPVYDKTALERLKL